MRALHQNPRTIALSILLSGALLTCAGMTLGAAKTWAFSSKDGVEVVLEFDGQVALPQPVLVPAHDGEPESTQVLTSEEQVAEQTKFLSGAFQFNPIKGGRRVDDEAQVTRQDSKFIYYHYKGKAILDKTVGDTYNFALPYDPATIYAVAQGKAEKNPCTDPHYQSEGDFFYFFNPANKGCKLRDGVDYYRVAAKLTRLPEAPVTYPDYARLIDKNGDITIHVLQGKNKDDTTRHPRWSMDVAASQYRNFSIYLRKQGFSEKRMKPAEVKAILESAKLSQGDKTQLAKYENLPFVREFSKKEGGVNVKVRFFYGVVSSDGDSAPLHAFWKDALENASVAIYNGHSGLGGNLRLDTLEDELGPIQVDPHRYQIWVLDGCSTYTYYQEPYFKLKARGLKEGENPRNHLQIVSTGLESAFIYNSITAQSLTNAILASLKKEQVPSWKELMEQMSHDNLLSVAGDEFAPKVPTTR